LVGRSVTDEPRDLLLFELDLTIIVNVHLLLDPASESFEPLFVFGNLPDSFEFLPGVLIDEFIRVCGISEEPNVEYFEVSFNQIVSFEILLFEG